MTSTIQMPEDTSKEVFTAKSDEGYLGCCRANDLIHITSEVYKTPLMAANAARKLKKNLTTERDKAPAKAESLPKRKKKPSVKLSAELYTTEQVQAMPLLKFNEVWVITKGYDYVSDCINKETKKIVEYSPNRSEAKCFADHVTAKRAMTTLKGVVGPGFGLLRYFVKTEVN